MSHRFFSQNISDPSFQVRLSLGTVIWSRLQNHLFHSATNFSESRWYNSHITLYHWHHFCMNHNGKHQKIRTIRFVENIHPIREKYFKLTKVTGVVVPVNCVRISTCPSTHSISDWRIMNDIDFPNLIQLSCRSASSFCTASTCSMSSPGSSYQYSWQDNAELQCQCFWQDKKAPVVRMSASNHFYPMKR